MNKNRVQISNGDREGNGEVGSYLSKIERQLETEFKGSEAALAKLFLSIKFSGGPGDRLIYSFQTLADKLGVRFDHLDITLILSFSTKTVFSAWLTLLPSFSTSCGNWCKLPFSSSCFNPNNVLVPIFFTSHLEQNGRVLYSFAI